MCSRAGEIADNARLTALYDERDQQRLIAAAARAFVEHHQSEQPWPLDPHRNPDREPALWAAQEAWHDEEDRLIAVLAQAVAAHA